MYAIATRVEKRRDVSLFNSVIIKIQLWVVSEKCPRKIILFFCFSVVSQNLDQIDQFVWTKELVYDVEIMIQIQKPYFCSINIGRIGKMSFTKSFYFWILQ